MTDNMADLFKDPEHIRTYAERPRKIVPGFDGLHRIMAQMVAEAGPERILVVGGGGGLELKTLIAALPDTGFCAVDPSAEMIAQGRAYLGDPASVDWIEGYVFDAPQERFDAATCMLTLHFVPDDGTRRATLRAIHDRLKPGAPLFMAHISINKNAPDSHRQFDRYIKFSADNGLDPDMLEKAHERVRTHLNCVGPERDEALLLDAGFRSFERVFQGLSWHGWVAYA